MNELQHLTMPEGSCSPVPLPASPSNNLSSSPEGPAADSSRALLTSWSQIIGRSYMTVAICFSFEGNKADAESHIKASLNRLRQQRGDFPGGLSIDPKTGCVYLESNTNGEIPFKVVDHGATFPFVSYDELKSNQFPLSAFVHPSFELDGNVRPSVLVPATQLQVSFIQGGLILWAFVHHSLTDGDGMRMFLECLAAQTRGEIIHHPLNVTIEPADSSSKHDLSPISLGSIPRDPSERTLEKLLSACPEYAQSPAYSPDTALATPTSGGPGWVPVGAMAKDEVPNRGFMFVFRNDQINRLRDLIESFNPDHQKAHRPSAYVALAALTWAHVTKARLATHGDVDGGENTARTARLMVCVDWKQRAFPAASKEYFGNAVAAPFTMLRTADVVSACADLNAIVPIVRQIQDTIASVDEVFVAQRTVALREAVSQDPRRMRFNVHPDDPRELGFNTWRHYGADIEWAIPGLKASKPDTIRPVRGRIGKGYGLVLPARRDSELHELAIYLPEKAMEALRRDEGYMRWVDHVVE